jgi:4-hydroxy-3-polyprenylbenzoate decarboxylase
MTKKRKIVVATSGASGVNLGLKTLELLPDTIEKHFIMSKNSQVVLSKEMKNIITHNNEDISASVASGSFGVDAMIIAPCSMNTLAKIACGISDNLVTRTAAVMIKEQKKLVLAPREMPFSAIALENMLKLSRLGIIIAPPVMAYYSEQQTLDEMENFIIGKWFDLLDIENNLYKRWE